MCRQTGLHFFKTPKPHHPHPPHNFFKPPDYIPLRILPRRKKNPHRPNQTSLIIFQSLPRTPAIQLQSIPWKILRFFHHDFTTSWFFYPAYKRFGFLLSKNEAYEMIILYSLYHNKKTSVVRKIFLNDYKSKMILPDTTHTKTQTDYFSSYKSKIFV